jgi:hypothetical protein
MLFILMCLPTLAFAHEGHIHATSGDYMYITHEDGSTDWMIDYAKLATKVATSGRWSEIWKGNEPGPQDIVLIPENVSVIYDMPPEKAAHIKTLAIKGSLTFDTTKKTEFHVGTILMYSGNFTINNHNRNTWTNIIFEGDAPTDKEHFNLGFITLGGEVNVVGAEANPSFYKISVQKGASIVTLPSTPPWRLGDEVFFSDSEEGTDASYWAYSHDDPKLRQAMPQEWEKCRIIAIVGNVITLDSPLQFTHNGYVADVTRNVGFKSATPDERAHIMFIGSTKVTFKNARIKDMGRTTTDVVDDTVIDANGTVTHDGKNDRARYALHLHHDRLPFIVSGNAIYGSEVKRNINGTTEHAVAGSPKWGIVNHDSFGDITNNIVIGAAGAGIVGEDGTETGTVAGNLVIGTGQGTGGGDDGRFAPMKGKDLAYGGFGYWFRGPFVNVTNNSAAGYFKVAGYGYFLHPDYSHSQLPDIVGMAAEYKGKNINVNSQGIHFSGNTADGIFGDSAFVIFYSSVAHTINDFTALNRNTNGRGMDIRYTKSFTINDSSIAGQSKGIALHSNQETKEIITNNTKIAGFTTERRVE